MEFVLAILALAVGSAFLWILSENIAGNEQPSLHIGNVVFVTIVGVAAFWFWRWASALAMLGIFGAWWVAVGIFERRR
jgi:hypothetical protein